MLASGVLFIEASVGVGIADWVARMASTVDAKLGVGVCTVSDIPGVDSASVAEQPTATNTPVSSANGAKYFVQLRLCRFNCISDSLESELDDSEVRVANASWRV